MARCGCSGTSCSCLVQALEGSPITVTGSGSGGSPYVIGGGGVVTVDDTATVDMTVTGDGSSGSPYVISADATVDVEELANLDTTGVAAGDVIAYDGTAWTTIPAPSASPGAVVTDSTLTGDGSGGSPLGVAALATGTYTPTWTATTTNPSIGSGSLTGRYHEDPTSGWVDVSIELISASDTAMGSGAWLLDLPVDAIAGRTQALVVNILYANGAARVGSAITTGGSGLYRIHVADPTRPTGANTVSGSLMSSFTSGSKMVICGRYEREP